MKRFLSNQKQDYPIQFAEFPGVYVRSLYARSAESRPLGSEGQDYLTWSYAGYGFGFVVCDGVGSSFCGNIAARYLGEKLIQFLLDTGPRLAKIDKPSGIAELVTARLQAWQEKGHEEVEATELPPGLPPLQVTALEQLKAEQGSETVFVCGWLSFDEGRLVLVWMGDAEARLFDRKGEPIDVGGVWRNADRWSTKHGPYKRGARVHAWVGDVEEQGLDRIVAFSDGLSAVADELPQLQDAELQDAVGRQLLSPSSDDIAFVDVRLRQPAASYDLAAPEVEGPDDGRLAWAEVAGARRYEVEEAGNGVFAGGQSHQVRKTEWPVSRGTLPETGYRHYRVRALVGETTGPWSPVLRLPPPELPAPASVGIEDERVPGSYTIVWKPVPGAQYYVLSELRDGDDREIYLGPALGHAVTERKPGDYVYRVRACSPAGQSAQAEVKHTVAGPVLDQSQAGRAGVPTGSQPGTQVQSGKTAPSATSQPSAKARVSDQSLLGAGTGGRQQDRAPASGGAVGRFEPEGLKQANGSQPPIGVGPTLPAPQLEELGVVKIRKRYTVRWSAVDGADSYELQEASELEAQGGVFDTLYEGPKREHDEKKSPGRYVYRVRAIGKDGVGVWSDPEAIEVRESLKLEAPPQLKARVQGDTIKVQWQEVPYAEWYVLEETSAPKGRIFKTALFSWPTTRKIRRKVPQAALFDLDSQVYQYRVRACSDEFENSDWSERSELLVVKQSSSSSFQLRARKPRQGRYQVQWNAVPPYWYVLHESRSPDFSSPREVYSGTSTYKNFSDQPPGRYYYQVFASDTAKKYDPNKPSNTIEVVVPPDRSLIVEQKTVGRDEITIDLIWGSVLGANRYEIQYLTTGRTIATTSSDRYTIEGLGEGQYRYRVRAVSDKGEPGEWSDEVVVEVERKQDRMLYARSWYP